MIARLKGQVVEREDRALIIDVQGVGYRVAVLSGVRERVVEGQEITLKIYHQISDDNETLYGFLSAEDLEHFQLLLTVPSVGPRTALNILDIAPPPILTQAVQVGDVALLTKVSGVGKKTAERIVVELKGKLVAEMAGQPVLAGQLQEEVIVALTSIGYSTAQAKEVVSKLPAEIATVEEAVRAALQMKVS